MATGHMKRCSHKSILTGHKEEMTHLQGHLCALCRGEHHIEKSSPHAPPPRPQVQCWSEQEL